jgi:undecaprenyl-diphosphatase
MIITQKLLGIQIDEFVKAFTVNIQFGAILSVVVLYWKRFFCFQKDNVVTKTEQNATKTKFNRFLTFYLKLFVAFLPAAVIGFLLGDFIDTLLENVEVVAMMLVLGGIILLFVDKWFNNPSAEQTISYPKSLKIGFFQCIAMIPGVSRSAATIIGGMTMKLSRKNAAEFSFFLAVPTMFAASAYKCLKSYKILLVKSNLSMLLIGNIVSFIIALLAIKFFIHFLTKYGFKIFGYYRIIVGLIILILIGLGVNLSIA